MGMLERKEKKNGHKKCWKYYGWCFSKINNKQQPKIWEAQEHQAQDEYKKKKLKIYIWAYHIQIGEVKNKEKSLKETWEGEAGRNTCLQRSKDKNYIRFLFRNNSLKERVKCLMKTPTHKNSISNDIISQKWRSKDFLKQK